MSSQLDLPFPSATSTPAADALRREAVALTHAFVRRARERWPKARLPDPKVAFDLRGLAAGEASPSDWAIRYNDELLARHGEEFLAEIVPHEVAHLVVAGRYRRKRCRPHGEEWREVMEFFGVAPRRCHSFEVTPARRMRRFAYRCSCEAPHLLTKRAHLRIRRGTAQYSCRRCGDVLVRVEGSVRAA